MAKDPAFLFYSSDFISGTLTMSYEQLGRYIRMLCLQHQKGILSERDMKVLAEGDEELISKFVKCNEGYYNERLRNETIKRNAYSESRRKNKSKNNMTNEDMTNICSTYDGHMENVIVNVNENKINDLIMSKFDISLCEIWRQWKEFKLSQFNFRYKTYQTELTAINNLYKLSNGTTSTAIEIINQSIANGWKGFFAIKQSVNQQRFEARVEYSNRYDK